MAKRIANKGRSTEESSDSKKISPSDIPELIKAQIDPIKDELSEYKAKIIEVLGIFVALFTFISIDFQIFKENISIISAIGVSLVTLGALSFFILLLFFSLNFRSDTTKQNKTFFVSLFLLSVLFIIGGVFCIWKESKNNLVTQSNLESYYSKDQTDAFLKSKTTQDDFLNFKKCLRDGQWNKCFQ